MKSFVINFTGDDEITDDFEEHAIIDACTIKGEVKTDSLNLADNNRTSVTLEIASLSPQGESMVWGSNPNLGMYCESTTLEDGRPVVVIWLSQGES